jgi:hypothetical protein
VMMMMLFIITIITSQHNSFTVEYYLTCQLEKSA